MKPLLLSAADSRYPVKCRERMGGDAPSRLSALGNLDLLALPKTGFFCSARSPGNIILKAYDQAARWRDAGRCIISGFHSPVEQECLQILLRGSQPIIICPARCLSQRVPPDRKKSWSNGRLLVLSMFEDKAKRVPAELAYRRNEFVAAMADEVFIAHVTVVGRLETLTRRLRAWGIPFSSSHL